MRESTERARMRNREPKSNINIIAFPGQSLYSRSNLITRTASIAGRCGREGRRRERVSTRSLAKQVQISIKTQSHKINSRLANKTYFFTNVESRAKKKEKKEKTKWNDFRENHDITYMARGDIHILDASLPLLLLIFFFEFFKFDQQWVTQSFACCFSLCEAQLTATQHNRNKQTNDQGEWKCAMRSGDTLMGRTAGRMGIASIAAALCTYSSHFEHAVPQTTTDESDGTATEMCFSFSRISAVPPKVIRFGWKRNYHFAVWCTHTSTSTSQLLFSNGLPWVCVCEKWWIKWIITTHWQVQWRTKTNSWANLLRLFQMCDYDYGGNREEKQ